MCRAFLWSGAKSTNGEKCKVAWHIACAPKDFGGLGLPDLRIMGYALRLRWEWLWRTDTESTWALLPTPKERMITAMSQASICVQVGDGSSAMFWTDSWLPQGAIAIFAPNLFKAVRRRALSRSVKDAIYQCRWVRDLSGALTAPVLCEYVILWEALEGINLQPTVADRFIWKWTQDGSYSASLHIGPSLE
jgi:hypothetical protein